jgi:hypothetical protein
MYVMVGGPPGKTSLIAVVSAAISPAGSNRGPKRENRAMSIQMILLPMFVLVALTFGLLFATAGSRRAAIMSGKVKVRDIALGQPAWPEGPTKAANCLANQLQAPVLFYLLVTLALFTKQADLLFVVMSWIFVATRLVHAYIHVGSNHVPHRFYAFAAGVVVLLIMWVIFVVRILVS